MSQIDYKIQEAEKELIRLKAVKEHIDSFTETQKNALELHKLFPVRNISLNIENEIKHGYHIWYGQIHQKYLRAIEHVQNMGIDADLFIKAIRELRVMLP